MSKRKQKMSNQTLANPIADDINRQYSLANSVEGLAKDKAIEALSHARMCGELLIEAKTQCEHDKWLSWLDANCAMSPRQAQNYMKLAKSWDVAEAKTKSTSFLAITEALEFVREHEAMSDCERYSGCEDPTN